MIQIPLSLTAKNELQFNQKVYISTFYKRNNNPALINQFKYLQESLILSIINFRTKSMIKLFNDCDKVEVFINVGKSMLKKKIIKLKICSVTVHKCLEIIFTQAFITGTFPSE